MYIPLTGWLLKRESVESNLKNMDKNKLDKLYIQVGQIQELLEDGYIHTAKEKVEELRVNLQNHVY